MRYSNLIFLTVTLLYSCHSWKREGVTKCIKVEEIPSSLIHQRTEANLDSKTKISIQLFSNNENTSFEYTRYKITNNLDSLYIGTFTETGTLELELSEGIYSVHLRNFDHPDFNLNTIKIVPFTHTSLEVKLGTNEGFMSIVTRQ